MEISGRTLANERTTKPMERDRGKALASIYEHSNKISKMHSLIRFCHRSVCGTASTVSVYMHNISRLCNDEGFHVRAIYDTIPNQVKILQKHSIHMIVLCKVSNNFKLWGH